MVSIGDPVPLRNLIEVVLDALPEEYDPIVVAMNSKEDLCSLDELESSLLAHESRLEKNRKVVLTEPVSVNLTQAPPSTAPLSTKISGVDSNPNFPVGTSHMTANAEIMAMVHVVVDLVGVVAVLVMVVAALGRFHVRFAIRLDMMHLYAITDTLTQVHLLFPHHKLPSIPTWWLHAPPILPRLDTQLLQGQRHPSIFNHRRFSLVSHRFRSKFQQPVVVS